MWLYIAVLVSPIVAYYSGGYGSYSAGYGGSYGGGDNAVGYGSGRGGYGNNYNTYGRPRRHCKNLHIREECRGGGIVDGMPCDSPRKTRTKHHMEITCDAPATTVGSIMSGTTVLETGGNTALDTGTYTVQKTLFCTNLGEWTTDDVDGNEVHVKHDIYCITPQMTNDENS